jgi:hypothetical protein
VYNRIVGNQKGKVRELSAEEQAEQLRDLVWGFGLPVDPVAIARDLGFKVYTSNLSGVSGMIDKKPGYDPKLYVNKNESYNRQRLNCAFELGYWVRRGEYPGQGWEHVSRYQHLPRFFADKMEEYARDFAVRLLVPESVVYWEARRGTSLGDLGELCKVPPDVVVYTLDRFYRSELGKTLPRTAFAASGY